MKRFKRSLHSVMLAILVSGWAGPGVASNDESAVLRGLIREQQSLIESLIANQQAQARELAELRDLLLQQASPVGLSTGNLVEESYDVAPQASPELAAAPPIQVLPGEARFSVGGHLNSAVNIADDGEDTEAYHVDSGSLPTLTYIKAYLPVSEDLTVGGHLE